MLPHVEGNRVRFVMELTPLSPQRDIVLRSGLNVSQRPGLDHGGSITVTVRAVNQLHETHTHTHTHTHTRTHMHTCTQAVRQKNEYTFAQADMHTHADVIRLFT